MALIIAAMMIVGLSAQVFADTAEVKFDFDGLGGAGRTRTVASWDYAPSSALAVFDRNDPLPIAQGDSFTLYTHGILTSTKSAADPTWVSLPGGAPAYEITVVTGFRETVSVLAGNTAVFSLQAGAPNFFEMYIDYTPDADSSLIGDGSAGTGFADGIKILSGGISVSTGNFTAIPQIVPLDSYNGDQASGAAGFSNPQDSVSGVGGSQVTISVSIIDFDRNYFYDVSDQYGLNLFFNTFNNLPFTQVDPSNFFYNGTGTFNLANYGWMGPVNGAVGTLFEFQVDGTASQQIVPEPGTMLLLGTGLLGAAIIGRKRMTK